MEKLKPYAAPLLLLIIFETVAIVLWLAKGELFYLLNCKLFRQRICHWAGNA